MRKVTETVIRAFIDGKPCKLKNIESTGDTLLLFGQLIAWRVDGKMYCTLAGFGTGTTRERLNGLYEILHGHRPFHQANHVQMFNGEPVGVKEIIQVTGA